MLYDDEKPETDQSSMDVIRAHVRQAIIDDIVDIDTQNPEGIRHVIEAHIIAVMEYYCSTPDEEAYGAAIGMAKHLKMYELERDLRENQEEINEAMETSETLGEDFIAFCDHMLL